MSGLWILLACFFGTGEILPAPVAAKGSPSTENAIVKKDVASEGQDFVSDQVSPQTSSRNRDREGEPLPAPRTMSATSKSNKLVAANVDMAVPQAGADSVRIGWGIDKLDNTLYMVVQIAPDAIAAFAAGPRGQELPCTIPPALRGRVEKVIIRVGVGPVEQNPPESELVRMPLLSSNQARIANLDMRSSVSIDAPRGASDVIPTVSTTQLPSVPSYGSSPGGTGEVLPTTVPPAYPSTATMPTPIGSTPFPSTSSVPNPVPGLPSTTPNGTGTNLTAGSSWPNPPATSPTTYGNPATYSNDGFQPPRTVPSTLNPFGSSRPTGNPPTSGQGNVTYGSSTTPTQPGAGYGYPSGNGNVPLMANNNQGVYPPGWNGQDANGAHATAGPPGYGNYVSANNPPYTNPGFGTQANGPLTNPVLPIPQLANRPLPTTSGGTTTVRDPQRYDSYGSDPLKGTMASPRTSSLVPFFFVLSLILNIYFGLWLNHLSTKYRHLLGNARGLSVAELDR